MADLSFDDAAEAAYRRQAEGHGADYADDKAILMLSDQLAFVRNNPISVEEEAATSEDGETTVNVVLMWGCTDEAAIALGRLAQRGWRLVQLDRADG